MNIYQVPSVLETGDYAWIARLDRLMQRTLHIRQKISVAVVSSAEMRKLNKLYRGKDQTTDVLSFNLDDSYDNELGEIVICWPQLKRQAREHGNDIETELKLLIVHGTLHLLGHDHHTVKETKTMRALETKILAKLR